MWNQEEKNEDWEETKKEESDDPTDPNAIVIHPLPWHSESECNKCFSITTLFITPISAELKAFLLRLDRHYDAKVRKYHGKEELC